jgi:hypothetical protein
MIEILERAVGVDDDDRGANAFQDGEIIGLLVQQHAVDEGAVALPLLLLVATFEHQIDEGLAVVLQQSEVGAEGDAALAMPSRHLDSDPGDHRVRLFGVVGDLHQRGA